MWETTYFDRGTEVGTFDLPTCPVVGSEIEPGVRCSGIRWIDRETKEINIDVEYC